MSASLGVLAVLLTAGCARINMKDQSRLKPLEGSDFFPDGRSSRPLVEGTVARGHLKEDEHFYKGTVGGKVVDTFPFAVTRDDLARGRERYDIFCSPCHSRLGDGKGMVVRRGLKRKPPSFHDPRLRNAPVGHYFDVMTNGFGAMYDYADRLSPKERWQIIAYIRALQLSQNAKVSDVPAGDRQKLDASRQ